MANASEFESLLLDIAQKADLADNTMLSLGQRITDLSTDLGRSQAEIAGVMDNLMGRGMDNKTAEGAGTSSEAATNTANLMQKIISPATKKKFAEAGIDIRKELKKVQDEGSDVFVFIADAVTRATGGDLTKIGDYFQDAQVQLFLIPLSRILRNIAVFAIRPRKRTRLSTKTSYADKRLWQRKALALQLPLSD